ncbi:hypothetical protein M407DRAFT_208479 [Tulasnella calospora MUT 4182]|uniref:Uncharacterized protein n=1 Tax=Tulasnella calospora MUT 4182 TaxID=1051891 RepID=A0A0C3LW57_9AGAM|nr:hypothetical protein M407DRAFT_208479 [Tulasnella calospora MUT 4182]
MSQRQSLGNSKRPLSAIFIGDLSNSSDSHSQSQLPSPPSTQGSGDGSLRGKPRQQMHDERPESRASQSRRRDSSDEDDDMRHRDDEDHTARLSDPRRSLTSSGSRTGSRAGFRRGDDEAAGTDAALHRPENLYARNRQVLDRISAITSHSRLNSPSPRPMPSKSPIPRPPSSAQAQRTNRLRHDTVSGSETERDQRRDSMSDEHSTPPQSAGIQSRFDDGYPPADGDYEAEAERGGPSRTLRRSLNGTVSRRRGLDPDSPLFSGAIHAAINDPPTSVRTSPHRTRNPLPLEFRDRPGYSGYVGFLFIT